MNSPRGEHLAGRRYPLYAVISALLGAGAAFLTTLGESVGIIVSVCLAVALVAVTMCTVIFVLHHAVSLWLEKSARLERTNPRFLATLVFVVGGVVGFLIGGALAEAIFPVFTATPPGGVLGFLAFLVIFSFGAFLVSYAYEDLRQRLQDSVERNKQQELAEKELELARSIQERLLPAFELSEEGFSVAARNEAATYVAGDYFDIFKLRNGDLGLVVADVAGKGIGASLIMASAKAMLPFIANEGTVAETLSTFNERLFSDLGKREFVALCFARFSVGDRSIEISNAGLPDPYRLTSDGRVESLEVGGQRLPRGVRKKVAYESREWILDPGDRLFMFSDGLAEASLPDGGPLGYERLSKLLPPLEGVPADWLTVLFKKLRSETNAELEDDWTAVLLQVT